MIESPLTIRRLDGGRMDGVGKVECMRIEFPNRSGRDMFYAQADKVIVRLLNVNMNKDPLRNRDIVRSSQR